MPARTRAVNARLSSAHARLSSGLVLIVWLMLAWVAVSAFTSCNKASADEAPAGFVVEPYKEDSLRVIGRWAKACDARGCADSYTARWTVGTFTKTGTRTVTADTVFVAKPVFGDSVMASLTVSAVRRAVIGAARTATTWLRNPDAPPPPVDSLKVDTLAVSEAAFLDTFPSWTARLSTQSQVMQVYEQPQVCILSRSRYTGEAVLLAPVSMTLDDPERVAQYESTCEPVRKAFELERGG